MRSNSSQMIQIFGWANSNPWIWVWVIAELFIHWLCLILTMWTTSPAVLRQVTKCWYRKEARSVLLLSCPKASVHHHPYLQSKLHFAAQSRRGAYSSKCFRLQGTDSLIPLPPGTAPLYCPFEVLGPLSHQSGTLQTHSLSWPHCSRSNRQGDKEDIIQYVCHFITDKYQEQLCLALALGPPSPMLPPPGTLLL